MKNLNHKSSGFTLIELMITLVIAGVLLAIGVPSLRDFMQNSRITTVTNELVAALAVARSEAIRQNTTACVCPSTTASAAVPACAASGSWETGWIAFSDFNGDCTINGVGANADALLKIWDGVDSAASMTVRNNNATINNVNSVRFNGRGEPFSNGASQTGNFSICDARPLANPDALGNVQMAAAVVVTPSGRSRSTRQQTQITYTAP